NWVVFFAMMQRYYFLLENMYRAMIIFWLTCLVGYPRTSAPEPIFLPVFVSGNHSISEALSCILLNVENGLIIS
ncbi:hypothetical protein V7T14_13575, partial [Segatella copri]|uniref:hypothetical protein n=1 Tax=Segatella copri TaxID=165179 RepID=UPI001C46A6D3